MYFYLVLPMILEKKRKELSLASAKYSTQYYYNISSFSTDQRATAKTKLMKLWLLSD
jgi:hypothetical protein